VTRNSDAAYENFSTYNHDVPQNSVTENIHGIDYIRYDLHNGDKVYTRNNANKAQRKVTYLFDTIYDAITYEAHYGVPPSSVEDVWNHSYIGGANSLVYRFTTQVSTSSMTFVNSPNAHYTGDIQIEYDNGTEFVPVVNPSETGFVSTPTQWGTSVTITFDEVTSAQYRIHLTGPNGNAAMSEWRIDGHEPQI
jgi:hypothetical protein